MKAYVGCIEGARSHNESAEKNKSNASMKTLFLRTAATASCAGFIIGVYWIWNQIPACSHTEHHKENIKETSFADCGQECELYNDGGLEVRRLAEVVEFVTFPNENEPNEKSLADLKHWRDILGIIIIGISCMAAVSAGTGGGSIYVPVMTLVMGFPPHASTVMSQSLMCGGVLAGTLLNICRRHPFADRPLIDMDLVIFLAPAQMAGVSVGMLVNHCLPAWLLVTLLVIILTIAVIQTVKQYRKVRRQGRTTTENVAGSCVSVAEVLEDAMALNLGESGFSIEGSAVFGASSNECIHQGLSDSRTNLEHKVQPRELHNEFNEDELQEIQEQDKKTRNSTCSRNSQIQASTTDDSAREGLSRGETLTSPEVGVLGYASETDVEAGGSRLALDFSVETEGIAACEKQGVLPEKENLDRNNGNKRMKGRLSRLRRARRKLKEMQKRHEIIKWSLLVVIWLIDTALGIIRGGKDSPVKLIPYCGLLYWMLFGSSAVALVGCSYFQGMWLYRLQRGRDEAAMRQVPGDLCYDLRTIHLFFFQTIVAGLVAGTVGIGSSLVLGPIMLMKGMLPVVCTAVNTALVLCGSSSAAIQSSLGSVAPWSYCFFLLGLCFVCALIGKSVVDKVARKYDADHIVILFLIIIMFGSMSGMVAAGIIGIIQNVGQDFKSPCM